MGRRKDKLRDRDDYRSEVETGLKGYVCLR